jgi:hypothetical protein
MVKLLILLVSITNVAVASYTPPSAMAAKLSFTYRFATTLPTVGSTTQDVTCTASEIVVSCGAVGGTTNPPVNCYTTDERTCRCVATPSFSTSAAVYTTCLTGISYKSGL